MRRQNLLATILCLLLAWPPAARAEKTSPAMAHMLNELSSDFYVAVTTGAKSYDRCELAAANSAKTLMKQKFVSTAADAIIFTPMTQMLKLLLRLIGLGNFIDIYDLTQAYINSGGSNEGFYRALAELAVRRLTTAQWDTVVKGTKTDPRVFEKMNVVERQRLLEKFFSIQVIRAGSDAVSQFDPSQIGEQMGKDETAHMETTPAHTTGSTQMTATWSKKTGRLYVNTVIRWKCPNSTDLKYGRVQMWAKVQLKEVAGKPTWVAKLVRYEIKAACCGEDYDKKYGHESMLETETKEKLGAAVTAANKHAETAANEARNAANASTPEEAEEAAQKAKEAAKKAEEEAEKARKLVKDAKAQGADTSGMQNTVKAAEAQSTKAGKSAAAAGKSSRTAMTSAANECKKELEKCEAEAEALKQKIEEAKKKIAGIQGKIDKVDGQIAQQQGIIDGVNAAENAFKNCEKKLQEKAAKAGVETRQDANGRTHIMGQASDPGQSHVSSAVWNDLVAHRRDCTKKYKAYKAKKAEKTKAEKAKGELDKKKTALQGDKKQAEAELAALKKKLGEHEKECEKKRKDCDKKRKAYIKTWKDWDEVSGSQPLPDVLSKSMLSETTPKTNRRAVVRKGQQAVVTFFSALEQEDLARLDSVLAEDFNTQDRLGLAEGKARFVQAAKLQFDNLSGTQFRVDASSMRVDPDNRTMQVTVRWDQRARFQRTGQEWLLTNNETNLFLEVPEEGDCVMLLTQGDPILRTNDFGVTLVDEGTVDLETVSTPFGLYSGSPVTQAEFLTGFPVDVRNSGTSTMAQPDLLVVGNSVSVVPLSPVAGQNFVVTAEILNTGQGLSPPVAAAFELNNRSVAQTQVPILEPAQSVMITMNVPGQPPGNFTSVVVVDSGNLVAEPNEQNNRVVGPSVNITPPPGPDLMAAPGSLSLNPPNPLSGTAAQFSCQIQNLGQSAAGASQATVRFNGNPVATQAVPPLGPGATAPLVINLTAPAPGAYAVDVQVDSGNQVTETNEGNNITGGLNTNVTQPQPDLTVSNLQIMPTNPVTGTMVTVQVMVSNMGNGASAPTQIDLLLGGTPVGSGVVPGLNQGQGTPVTFQVTAPAPAPLLASAAVVDPANQVAESNEGNNTVNGPNVTVQPPPMALPDLEILPGTIVVAGVPPGPPPATVQAAPMTFNVQAQVRNSGPGPSAASEVLFTLNGVPVGPPVNVPPLAPGQVVPVMLPNAQHAGAPGLFNSQAQVDPAGVVNEANEGNNTQFGPQVQVIP